MADGCFNAIFEGTVLTLHQAELLDVSIIHGDGTTTAAKKGGDNIGFNGHKKIKGDKVVAFCDRNCNVIAPFISAPEIKMSRRRFHRPRSSRHNREPGWRLRLPA
jgi:hypothetical protein